MVCSPVARRGRQHRHPPFLERLHSGRALRQLHLSLLEVHSNIDCLHHLGQLLIFLTFPSFEMETIRKLPKRMWD